MAELLPEDIAHLSHLARLRLTEEERERYARQLSGVVEYIEQLSGLAVSPETFSAGVTGLTNVLAADVARGEDDLACVATEALVSGAPRRDGDFIQVRAVLAEEAGGA